MSICKIFASNKKVMGLNYKECKKTETQIETKPISQGMKR